MARIGQRLTRARDARGAILVEAAFVLPLLIVLVLGIVEYSIAFNKSATVANASRAGARTASALPKDADYATKTADSVAAALTSLGSDAPQEMWVYKVATGTDDDPIGGSFGSCSDCIGYTWNSAARTFNTASPMGSDPWTANEQNACVDSTHPDRLGIYVKAEHEYLSGMFGTSRTLESRTVVRLEPYVGSGVCFAT
jgi:Flp pilus assembly protein TadG